jgi:integrase
VVKLQAPTVKRERRLTDLELKALGKALRESTEAHTLILAMRLALLAGMRKGEIQKLRWEWIDLDAGEVRIPADSHKTGKKTGKPRIVHLCSALVDDLKATVRTLGCP